MPAPLLELSGVAKTYRTGGGAEIPILKGIDLSIAPGESLAVEGPSGSGKSTLLHLMGLLDRPTAGRVLLDGRDVTGLPEGEAARIRAREIGFVFQAHHLLPQCSVLENVLVPTLAAGRPDPEAERRARRLLQRVGLSDRLDHRPGSLSGGECQRTAVVRALVNRPRLLLADEPTGSLDRASAEALGRLLGELNREEGVALVVVTHSPALAAGMGRRFELRDGRLHPIS